MQNKIKQVTRESLAVVHTHTHTHDTSTKG